ncbi:MAG: glycosyltransferase family A protein [Devosia sp.]
MDGRQLIRFSSANGPMRDISVVIPLFNKGPHIERALNSVMAQSVRPKEIIVVDDGSTDGGFDFVRGLKLPGLITDQRPTPGPGGYAARNRGIELATGDWIAFLDADDEWQPHHLASILEALSTSAHPDGVVTVFSGYENYYPGGGRDLDPFTTVVGGGAAELDFPALLGHWVTLNASPMWTSATVCRRQALNLTGAFPAGRCTRGGDKDTWLRVAYLGTAIYTGVVSANYYRDAVNMTTNRRYANSVPCISQTAVDLAGRSEGAVRQNLRKLQNLEIFNYALSTSRTETLARSSWQDFDRSIDPLRAIVLNVLSTRPLASAARAAYSLLKSRRR